METLKTLLMDRESLSSEEADDYIQEIREFLVECIEEGLDPEEELMANYLLEPDYIFELLDGM